MAAEKGLPGAFFGENGLRNSRERNKRGPVSVYMIAGEENLGENEG